MKEKKKVSLGKGTIIYQWFHFLADFFLAAALDLAAGFLAMTFLATFLATGLLAAGFLAAFLAAGRFAAGLATAIK